MSQLIPKPHIVVPCAIGILCWDQNPIYIQISAENKPEHGNRRLQLCTFRYWNHPPEHLPELHNSLQIV